MNLSYLLTAARKVRVKANTQELTKGETTLIGDLDAEDDARKFDTC